jgi:hypothetical protein
MVSPPFKFGQPISSEYAVVSADGAQVLYNSIGAFGGAPDNATPADPFLGKRGSAGWTSESLDPSAEEFRRTPLESSVPLALNENLSKVLLGLRPTSAPSPYEYRFYIRETGGAIVPVGPAESPAKMAAWTEADAEHGDIPSVGYEGQSADLSHVVFNVVRKSTPTDWLWPEDSTVRGVSLYEYIGPGHTGAVGDEPLLVGVDNAGHLISQCGTVLGAPSEGFERSEDSYNAISSDGSTIYFTVAPRGCENGEEIGEGPPRRELYARRDGGTPSAETVDISEPSKSDCALCETFETEPERRFRGIFQGASSDGSKVFFLSRQALLPGSEEGVLALYEFDFSALGGQRVSLVAPHAASGGGVMRVSEDGSHVYFVSTEVLATNPDAKNEQATPGADNMYVLDTNTSAVTFVATLSETDREDWKEADGREVEATPDGRFITFSSFNDLTPDAHGVEVRQLYRYDAVTGSLIRVSIGENGFADNGNMGNFVMQAPEFGSHVRTASRATAMSWAGSQEGRRIFFGGSAALTKYASNEVCVHETGGECVALAQNIYEWEQEGDGSCPSGQSAGCVFLISDGKDHHAITNGSAVAMIGASPTGDDVFFTTADPLGPQDTDTQSDLYDARVEGGFATEAPPPPCGGAGCEGPASTSPTFSTPASELLSGPGNVSPPPTVRTVTNCLKGKKLSHGKCVPVCHKGKHLKKNKCVANRPTAKHRKKAKHASRRKRPATRATGGSKQ